jgi:hypothetical protein
MDPLNALSHVLLLLLLEYQFNEELLQLLVAVVDAELLKTKIHTENNSALQSNRMPLL